MAQESVETRVARLEEHVQTLDEKAAELQKQQKNMRIQGLKLQSL